MTPVPLRAVDAPLIPDPWGEADTTVLGTGRRPVPPFPIDCLGPFWADWVKTRAAGASAPVDYVAASLLATVGGLLANVRWPVAGAQWSEPPIVWVCLVGSPSSGKSPAMDPVMKLLGHAEAHLARDHGDDLREFEGRKLKATLLRKQWEEDGRNAVAEGRTPPPRPKEAMEPPRPERPRVRVDDATSERLGAFAAALPRGLLLVRDELAGWFGSFDRYGGAGADRALALQMYGGREHRIDRVKHPEGYHVRHLSIGVVGGTQPDRLHVITDGDDDGLASRMLWTWPDAVPNFTLCRHQPDGSKAKAAFLRLADLAMGTDRTGIPEPKCLRLTRDAEDRLETVARRIDEVSDAGTGIAGTLGKARGQILRLSCILQHLWWCEEGTTEPWQIDKKAVDGAAALVEGYFLPMARRVFGDAAVPAVERDAMLLARHLRESQLTEFNARKLGRSLGRLREAKLMDAACANLVEANLIRYSPSRRGDTPGRPTKSYVVNPVVSGRDP